MREGLKIRVTTLPGHSIQKRKLGKTNYGNDNIYNDLHNTAQSTFKHNQ